MSLIHAIAGKISDSAARFARLDFITHTLQEIDFAHHMIHAGYHFMYFDPITLNAGVSQDYLITVPDTTMWPHMIFELDGTAVTSFFLYEGADRNGSALQTPGNNNRNSATVNTTLIHKGTAGGTTDGTLIYSYSGGTATGVTRTPTEIRNDNELILKRNTKYVLRATSGTAGNLINIGLLWYEHINKT